MTVIRFIPERDGLKPVFENPHLPDGRVKDERRFAIEIDATIAKDHGIMTIPVRLPRHLMPEWSQNEWETFIKEEEGFFHGTIDEAVVQCLSLALVSDTARRAAILRTANQVVVDLRGDIPNKYLPMVLGGYKVGVYRSGHGWPIWLSIQPTYDLALKEAEKIRAEAGLPKKDIEAVGALANFLNARTGLTPIMSSAAEGTSALMWLVIGAAIVAVAAMWLFK